MVLVTGAAGFIGFHLSSFLLEKGIEVVGIDNMNDYYDPRLKEDRLDLLLKWDNFRFERVELSKYEEVKRVFTESQPEIVVNLAAQAGVRYSLENPHVYVESNVMGFVNILEASKEVGVKHLLYASSSSVYGGNKSIPFNANDTVDHPVSLYAATKKSNELMAHTYSHLYGLPTTGMRFFTVYGPWGRPDMAYFSFAKSIIAGNPIKVFNYGNMMRDFTYISDIVESIYRLMNIIPKPNEDWNKNIDGVSSSYAPYKVYNIGNGNPVELMSFINILEKELGINAHIEFADMQSGDVLKTYADTAELVNLVKFEPKINIEEGLKHFVNWYVEYYGVTRR